MMKIVNMAVLALVLMVVGNAEARVSSRSPPAGEVPSDCDPLVGEAMMKSMVIWIKNVISDIPSQQSAAPTIIQTCDLNNDNVLSQTEYRECIQDQMDSPISDSCFNPLWNMLDRNHDGQLDADELQELIAMLAFVA